jgi:hypothetical protein
MVAGLEVTTRCLVFICQSNGGEGAMRPGELRGGPWRAAPARLLARLGRAEGGAARGGGRAPPGVARGGASAWRPKEEDRWGKNEGKKKKEKREKKKEKREKKKENRKKENKGRKIEKGFRKLGEFLEKLGEAVLRIFLGFSDTGVNYGTAVMARRTGQRDRGVRGIPGVVADRGAGATRRATARAQEVPAGFAARAPMVREGDGD